MSLHRLKEIAERLPSNDREWLLAGVQRYRDGEPLDIALGLTGAEAIRHRDMLLRRVAELLNADGVYTVTCVAGLLETALLRFECRLLPRYRKNPGMQLSEIDKLFAEMFELNIRIPRKKRHLFDLIS